MIQNYKLLLKGYEYGASGHDLSKNQFKNLKNVDLNLENISLIIKDYDRWKTNYWCLSKPLIDQNLTFICYDLNENIIWESDLNSINDLDEHSKKFPEIMNYDSWDEYEEVGDAIIWEDHPCILYYEEINMGIVAKLFFESDTTPKINDFSTVNGILETEDKEIDYIDKVYFKNKLLRFEKINWDLKQINSGFKLFG